MGGKVSAIYDNMVRKKLFNVKHSEKLIMNLP